MKRQKRNIIKIRNYGVLHSIVATQMALSVSNAQIKLVNQVLSGNRKINKIMLASNE